MSTNQCWYYNDEQCSNVPDQGRYCKKHVKYCLTLYFRYKQHEALAQDLKKSKKRLYYFNLAVIDRMEFTNYCVPPEHRDEGHSKRIKDLLDTIHQLESEIKPKVLFPTVEEGKVDFKNGFFDSFLQTMERSSETKEVEIDFIKMRDEELIEFKQLITDQVDKLWDRLQLLTKSNMAITPATVRLFIDNAPFRDQLDKGDVFRELDYDDLYDLVESYCLLQSSKLLHDLNKSNRIKDTKDVESSAIDIYFVLNCICKLSETNVDRTPMFCRKIRDELGQRFDQHYKYATPYFESLIGGIEGQLICFICCMLMPMIAGGMWTDLQSINESHYNFGINFNLLRKDYEANHTMKDYDIMKRLMIWSGRDIGWTVAASKNPHLYNLMQRSDDELMKYTKLGFEHLWLVTLRHSACTFDLAVKELTLLNLGKRIYRLWLINWKECPTIKYTSFCYRIEFLICQSVRVHIEKKNHVVAIEDKPTLLTFTLFANGILERFVLCGVHELITKLLESNTLIL